MRSLWDSSGTYVSLLDAQGREHVWIHLQEVNGHLSIGDEVEAGTLMGRANNSGNSRGDHLHYSIWTSTGRMRALDGEALLSNCD
jgi:murein DD-endopeptidase MepM/ murein hydrolase activator NlpD